MGLSNLWFNISRRYWIFRKLRNIYWWIAHRLWMRFDVIWIPTLEPGYHDADNRLLHGCFALLVVFVEKELDGFKQLNKSIQAIERDMFIPGRVDEEPWLVTSLSGKEVVRDLYLYWTVERPKLLKENNDDELDIYHKDNEMLIKLISVREQLWT